MASTGPSITQQVTQKTNQARALVASFGMMLIAVAATVIALVLVLRLFGVPVQFVTAPSDLVPWGVFLFCAAYALGKG